jgi:hypothetical protein
VVSDDDEAREIGSTRQVNSDLQLNTNFDQRKLRPATLGHRLAVTHHTNFGLTWRLSEGSFTRSFSGELCFPTDRATETPRAISLTFRATAMNLRATTTIEARDLRRVREGFIRSSLRTWELLAAAASTRLNCRRPFSLLDHTAAALAYY